MAEYSWNYGNKGGNVGRKRDWGKKAKKPQWNEPRKGPHYVWDDEGRMDIQMDGRVGDDVEQRRDLGATKLKSAQDEDRHVRTVEGADSLSERVDEGGDVMAEVEGDDVEQRRDLGAKAKGKKAKKRHRNESCARNEDRHVVKGRTEEKVHEDGDVVAERVAESGDALSERVDEEGDDVEQRRDLGAKEKGKKAKKRHKNEARAQNEDRDVVKGRTLQKVDKERVDEGGDVEQRRDLGAKAKGKKVKKRHRNEACARNEDRHVVKGRTEEKVHADGDVVVERVAEGGDALSERVDEEGGDVEPRRDLGAKAKGKKAKKRHRNESCARNEDRHVVKGRTEEKVHEDGDVVAERVAESGDALSERVDEEGDVVEQRRDLGAKAKGKKAKKRHKNEARAQNEDRDVVKGRTLQKVDKERVDEGGDVEQRRDLGAKAKGKKVKKRHRNEACARNEDRHVVKGRTEEKVDEDGDVVAERVAEGGDALSDRVDEEGDDVEQRRDLGAKAKAKKRHRNEACARNEDRHVVKGRTEEQVDEDGDVVAERVAEGGDALSERVDEGGDVEQRRDLGAKAKGMKAKKWHRNEACARNEDRHVVKGRTEEKVHEDGDVVAERVAEGGDALSERVDEEGDDVEQRKDMAQEWEDVVDSERDLFSSGEEYGPTKAEIIQMREDEADDDDEDNEGDDEVDNEGDGDTLGKDRVENEKGNGKKKRKSRKCEECSKEVVNLPRHYQLVHKGMSMPEKVPMRKVYVRTKKVCKYCKVGTIRLDQHLITQHSMKRDTETFTETLSSASIYVKAVENEMEKCLRDYTATLMDRSDGNKRTASTAQTHICGIKVFLKELTGTAINELKDIGRDNGVIDELLLTKRYRPESLKIYLSFVSKFLYFITTSPHWQMKLSMTKASLETIAARVNMIGKSLEKDIHKLAVERQAKGLDEVKVKDFMLGGYLASSRIQFITDALEEGESRKLRRNELLEIRDCLCVLLLLSNAKRSGDVAHIRRDTILEMEQPEDPDASVEIKVFEHKEAKSGKLCSLLVTSFLLKLMKTFARLSPDSSLYLFSSKTNKPLVPSTMSKLVQREWGRYAKETGQVLPRLTASSSRKVAVTTLRESGGDREQQMVLAKHMAHNISTADIYYDKSSQRDARADVIEKITQSYLDAAASRKESQKDATMERRGGCEAELGDGTTTTNRADGAAGGSSGDMGRAERQRSMAEMRKLQREMRDKKMYSESDSS